MAKDYEVKILSDTFMDLGKSRMEMARLYHKLSKNSTAGSEEWIRKIAIRDKYIGGASAFFRAAKVTKSILFTEPEPIFQVEEEDKETVADLPLLDDAEKPSKLEQVQADEDELLEDKPWSPAIKGRKMAVMFRTGNKIHLAHTEFGTTIFCGKALKAPAWNYRIRGKVRHSDLCEKCFPFMQSCVPVNYMAEVGITVTDATGTCVDR